MTFPMLTSNPFVEWVRGITLLVILALPNVETSAQSAAQLPPQLLALDRSNSGDLTVRLRLEGNRRTFAKGERMRYIVEANRDCFVALLSFQADGSWLVLYPNPFESDLHLRAERPRLIPDPEATTYDFIVDAPFGSDLVCALACSSEQELAWKMQQLIRSHSNYVSLDRGIFPIALASFEGSDGDALWDIDWVRVTTTETLKFSVLPILPKPLAWAAMLLGGFVALASFTGIANPVLLRR
jgi:hypothetical protein